MTENKSIASICPHTNCEVYNFWHRSSKYSHGSKRADVIEHRESDYHCIALECIHDMQKTFGSKYFDSEFRLASHGPSCALIELLNNSLKK